MITHKNRFSGRRLRLARGFLLCALTVLLAAACQRAAAPGSTPAVTPGQPTLPVTQPTRQPGIASEVKGPSFQIPPDWTVDAGGWLRGEDGFARLEVLPDDGTLPSAICQAEANRENPNRYGAFPQIFDLRYQEDMLDGAPEGAAQGCLILPSDDQPPERDGAAVYYLWLDLPGLDGQVHVLHADREHIVDIANSMTVDPTTAAAPGACDTTFPIKDGETSVTGGLNLDEFPIARGAGCDPFSAAETFNARMVASPAAGRAADLVTVQWGDDRVERLNRGLNPFGYRIRAADRLFVITKGKEKINSRINWIGQLSVNASGTDFILPVVDSYNMDSSLLRPEGIQPLDEWSILLYDRVFPVFVGDDRIDLAYDYQRYPRQIHQPALLQVRKNGETIQTLSVSGGTSAGGPARGLWSWDGHWLVELNGVFVQDGELLNDTLGASEMFAYRHFRDKPFYFFRQDGQVHLSYDGETLPVTYDEVIYTPQPLMNTLLQMQLFEGGLLYYARRGDTWYYVALEAVDEES